MEARSADRVLVDRRLVRLELGIRFGLVCRFVCKKIGVCYVIVMWTIAMGDVLFHVSCFIF